jgi:hypothetical protein
MKNNNKKEKGSALYFAVAIISIVLGIVLGASSILITQIRIIREMGYSVAAIYSADSGIERILFDIRKMEIDINNFSTINESFGGGEYQYEIKESDFLFHSDPGCDAMNICIKATGRYSTAKRGIEIEF